MRASSRRGVCAAALGAALLAAPGCAVTRFTVPADAGAPLSDALQVHAQVSAPCRGVRTLTAELGLSGRAGRERVRGRVVAGFESPQSMRLEGVGPFGPVFVFAARGDDATLLLTREARVVRGARAEQILGALTGVELAPADVQAILTGCVVPSAVAVAGRQHAGGIASVELERGTVLYLRRVSGAWVLLAARRDGWAIEYPRWQGAFPAAVRLRSTRASVDVDVGITLAQLETNTGIDPRAFEVDVPPGASALTIAELREAGPLRGRDE